MPREEWNGKKENPLVLTNKEVPSTEGFFSSMMLVVGGLGETAGSG
jgi:hypothetical protein